MVLIWGGMAWAAVCFQNIDGSAFNPLRNFVSELGSEKLSRAAFVINGCYILGNPLFFPLVIALGRRLGNRLGRLAIATGFCALLGAVGVAFASMDHLKPHLVAALLFFWSWLATALLFTIGFWRKYPFRAHATFLLAGVAALLASTAFLTVLTHALMGSLGASFQNPNAFARPAVWAIAILEWCVVASFFLWTIAAIFVVRRPYWRLGWPGFNPRAAHVAPARPCGSSAPPPASHRLAG
ncbi:MAG TPA: hypothetical protein VGO11_00105 [Chthoniobacteraceae bacterium]|jgi:hypothetical protein|nr:hypothetical protein [Chthoniobacteraceae bacterium]